MRKFTDHINNHLLLVVKKIDPMIGKNHLKGWIHEKQVLGDFIQ